MRSAFIAELYDLAKSNKDVMGLVADNGAIVYDQFRRDFPKQFMNFGISEATMVSVAAGLASCGKIPFAYTISVFLTMRAYEQVRDDVCLQKMNVKLVGIGAGFGYADLGPTHHATEDIALMRSLPEITVLSPADPVESKMATRAAAELTGPVYLRLGTGRATRLFPEDHQFIVGKGVLVKEGSDVTIMSTGGMLLDVIKAHEELERSGLSVRVVHIHTIKPLDKKIILESAQETGAILTVEEHSIYGGFGGAVAEVLAEECVLPLCFKRLGLKGVFPDGYGTHQEMKDINGLSYKHIMTDVLDLYANKKSKKPRSQRQRSSLVQRV